MVRPRSSQKGFTLVELVIVMAVIAVILSVVMPLLKGMQDESQLTKAEGDLKALKSAVSSYWKNNSNVYPSTIASLVNASPQIISEVPRDPWDTGQDTGEPGTYGYITGTDASYGDWFLICTRGPKPTSGGGGGGSGLPSFNAVTQRVEFSSASTGENNRCVSNYPVYYSDGVQVK